MEVSIINQALVMLYSVALGAALGFIYDFFRIIRVVCGINYNNKFSEKIKSIKLPKIKNPMESEKNKISQNIFVTITDLLYFIVATPIVTVFTYHFNNGKIRWFILAGIIAGFLIYYFTFGKLVISVSEYISFFIKVVFSYTVYFLLKPIIKLFLFLKEKTDKKFEKIKEKRNLKVKIKEDNKRKQNTIIYYGKRI